MTPSLSKQLAEALKTSSMTAREKEEWALFSAYMPAEQVQELIELLLKQSTEELEAFKQLHKKVTE